MDPRTLEELVDGLEEVRRSPADEGTVELIVRRPEVDAREAVEEAALDRDAGLVGDNWLQRETAKPEGVNPASQLTLTNSRGLALMAGDRERWPLAGDQFYVDLHLGYDNLPPGTRLALGSAVIEITEKPHNGCLKFSERFGPAALRFVAKGPGKELNLRGIYARVVEPGAVRRGDTIRKLGR